MAKSKIKKGIVRGIQTKKFEQVTITVEIEEEFEWKNEAERTKKADKVTNMLMVDFKKTYDEVVNVLGVDRCIGNVETSAPVKASLPDKSFDEVDLFGD